MKNLFSLKDVTGILFGCSLLIISCNSDSNHNQPKPGKSDLPAEFEQYWGAGGAEISTFDLVQSYDGRLFTGEAILVFEKEKYSKSRQIKTYKTESKKGDIIDVLRFNQSRNFNTDYTKKSLMCEVHVPVHRRDGQYAFKATCSSQDWIGQSYSQLSLDVSKYTVQLRSYLETEGDQNRVTTLSFPEDQLWCNIRMNPKLLPSGDMLLIPGLISNRLRNSELTAMKARVRLTKTDSLDAGNFQNMLKYSINYVDDDRLIEIFFSATAPYEIYGWRETYKDGSGTKAHKAVTIATRKKIYRTDFLNNFPLKESDSGTVDQDSVPSVTK